MRTRSRSARATVVMAAAGVLLLSACGGQPGDTRVADDSSPAGPSSAPRTPPASAAEPQDARTATPALTPEPASVDNAPNAPTALPPGDPGPDAPSVPDPGRPGHDRDHHAPALKVVPTKAMLDTPTVSSVLGGDWQRSNAQPPRCVDGTGAVGERTVAYRSADGRVLHTVATHHSLAAADRTVDELARRLGRCGWTSLPDPRMGTASAAASSPDETRTAVMISAEGVTVTLVGSDGATARRARWSSLLDLALGDSCAAAAHGCH